MNLSKLLRRVAPPVLLVFAACLPDPTAPVDTDVGCPGATYPSWETSPYVLPYPVGRSYQIDLSNCGGSFHRAGGPDEFAIDFAMPIGTSITASRPGTVAHVEESGVDGDFPNRGASARPR